MARAADGDHPKLLKHTWIHVRPVGRKSCLYQAIMSSAELLAGHVLGAEPGRADEVEKQLAEQSLAVQRAEAKAEAEATRVVGRMEALDKSTNIKLGDTKRRYRRSVLRWRRCWSTWQSSTPRSRSSTRCRRR